MSALGSNDGTLLQTSSGRGGDSRCDLGSAAKEVNKSVPDICSILTDLGLSLKGIFPYLMVRVQLFRQIILFSGMGFTHIYIDIIEKMAVNERDGKTVDYASRLEFGGM